MVRKKNEIMPALILISIVLSGCSKNAEPDVAKTDNPNQAPTASNNNIVPSSTNVSANGSNTPTPIVNNTPLTTPVNQDKKSTPRANEPTPQTGSGGGDMFLFTQVRGALSSDKELLNGVIVEIKEGNATLTGKVSSEAQKAKAAQLVQSVNGIKNVKNNLRVQS